MVTGRLTEALKTTRSLESRIYKLTDEELALALRLEDNVMRRRTILNRLQREVRRRARNKNLQP